MDGAGEGQNQGQGQQAPDAGQQQQQGQGGQQPQGGEGQGSAQGQQQGQGGPKGQPSQEQQIARIVSEQMGKQLTPIMESLRAIAPQTPAGDDGDAKGAAAKAADELEAVIARHAEEAKRDHPRACGEHRQGRVGRDAVQGSSPRMRGAPHSFEVFHIHTEIIPAHAGSTSR